MEKYIMNLLSKRSRICNFRFYKSRSFTSNKSSRSPPIFVKPSGLYWFTSGSPFAMKFLKIMRRVKETDLMHRPGLVYKNSRILIANEINRDSIISDDIELEQLLTTLCFFYTVSAITFISELILFKIERKQI